MFIDSATVMVEAGTGGNGCRSFRREKYVDRGGPDGGDGGDGGSVIFKGAVNVDGLASFRHSNRIQAKNGQPGSSVKCHGRRGAPAIVLVPLGTQVYNSKKDMVADIVEDGQEIVVAKGGEGGFGNAHFISSRRRAPQVAELGLPGEKRELKLELKLIADVGLVGLPNAGKSTLLSTVSNARPKIADYPFTTMNPHLGVIDRFAKSVVMADIPGIIEGASSGKGLGYSFLKHIERTAVLLHMVDGFSEHVAEDYRSIVSELEQYSQQLSKRERVVVVTKSELLDQDMRDQIVSELEADLEGRNIHFISSFTGDGIEELLATVFEVVAKERAEQVRLLEQQEADGLEGDSIDGVDEPVVFTAPEAPYTVTKISDTLYAIKGSEIERFALKTDTESPFAVERLRDIMHKSGVWRELEQAGATVGSHFEISGKRFEY